MSNADDRSYVGMSLLGLLLAIGLMLGGLILGEQIKATRLGDRYVSVRGLAQRTVKSDLAIWNLGYTDAGDDLSVLYTKSESDKKTILDFLARQGIKSSEIELGIVSVTDTQASGYTTNKPPSRRYVVQQGITVRTSRVDTIAAAAQETMQLVQRGVVLNNGSDSGLSYEFTSLNAIKPDMITEATRNARIAADRFASDSGSRVGAIRQATQGVFSILAANAGGDSGEYSYAANDESSIMKKVRVVTSVQYYLAK